MKKKKILLPAACVCLFLCLGYFVSREQSDPRQPVFAEYAEEWFREQVSLNTINLHYTLKNPENYGIKQQEATLGSIGEQANEQSVMLLENTRAALDAFDRNQLNTEYRMIYDMLQEEVDLELTAADLYLYQEPLRPSTGIAGELPVLLAEYAFYEEKDIQDYLMLLQEMPSYFEEILDFERQKASAGLFMPAFAAQDVIEQCKNFIRDVENNYLLDTFVDKIRTFSGDTLSEEQIKAYIQQNEEAVRGAVVPAYESLIGGLEEICMNMQQESWNQQGLYYLPEGRDYYAYLVKSYTGSDMSIEEMQQAAKARRAYDLSQAGKLIGKNPELLTVSTSYSFDLTEPMDILNQLQQKMRGDFPACPDTDFSVKYVHPSLEEYMAPAFYLAVPIDDISQNSIYINRSSNYQKLKLYTTLAHEGFPGHLYQNLMERSQDYPPIRSILGTSGYSEGWATYVEMLSYTYAELEDGLAELLMHDQSALLSLYATADLGIHGNGWSYENMASFFGEYQITNQEALTEIYRLIVEEPAHYLKYYIGYLEFLNLKEYAEEMYGEHYSDYGFHEALMKMGPAQFPILKEYLPEYYSSSAP